MPQYWTVVGQHGHHFWTPGLVDGLLLPLAQLLFPLLFILLVAVLWRAAHLGASRRYRPRPPAPRPLSTRSTLSTRSVAGPPMRASDRERDETVQVVSAAVGEGRLSLDEGRERIAAALSARYRHELDAILADLPRPTPSPAKRERPPRGGRARPRLGAVAAFAVVGLVLVLAHGLWPLGVAALAVVAFSRR